MGAAATPPVSRGRVSQLLRQFRLLVAPYWRSERKWRIRAATAWLVLLTMAQVGLAIWISYWNRELFDALEERSLSDLARQTLTFVLIFVLTMAVTAAHLHIKRWVQLDWRKWMTSQLLDRWMAHAHLYRLNYSSADHDNPDGRIAEDVRIATDMAITLAHSLLFSLLILGSFVDILLEVSGTAPVPGTSFAVPGFMVAMAFVYAGVGTVLGLMLGRPLIRSTNVLQAVEANFRFGLARAREHSEPVAMMRGERFERRAADQQFADVGRGWNLQTLAYLGIVSFSTGYGTLLPVFPILIAAPQYIGGAMSLGLLMQAAQAFQRLTSALSWPVDNLGDLARCRASIDRIVALYEDLDALERRGWENDASGERIRVIHSHHPELRISGLRLESPSGQVLLEDFELHVRRGERILITGDPALTISLFKAVAGLWPWGRGEISLPEGRDMMFLPQRPFLPEGTLRAVLSYPQRATRYSDAALHRALECAGISWLAPRLDESEDWSRSLSLRAQQRLGIARLFLQQPGWVFIEEATDAFDLKDEVCTMEMLHHELPSTTLLNISLHNGLFHFYDRKLVLTRQREPAARAREAAALPEA
ncbi:ABC transporter, ATP-binding cassette [Azoarcus olearius]|uniref:ABC transporter ATP-binding protein/permease n=1 Tax=Azoarcus sp. (strain BH72) TaxID=418699 RepID=UPI0008063D01|nr:ABC transporter ATP-binding protein/permease [Azoarcus olearius]ANQ85472.1 ABC transporter, ATP-binding cassette [Azoarcus olearius]